MYAVYAYKAGSTQAQVLADLVALLTGTTDVTTLSASCNQASSSIIATVPAGWTVHDATAGVNQQVVKALNQDGTTYKYMLLNATSTTVFNLNGYEAWNAATHAGTNVCGGTAPGWNWSASVGGIIYVYATSKTALFYNYLNPNYSNPYGVFEFTRDTVSPAGYPCFATLNGGSFGMQSSAGAGLTRFKNYAAAGDTANTTGLISPVNGVPYSISNNNPYQGAHTYRDPSEAVYLCTYPVGLTLYSSSYAMWVGSVYDLRAAGSGGMAVLDEFAYNGQTYVCWFLPAMLLVPKA